MSSGVINSTQLPPLGHPQGIEEDMNEQMMDEMDMDDMQMDPYGQEMDPEMQMEMEEEEEYDDGVTFEQIRDTIEKIEDKAKD